MVVLWSSQNPKNSHHHLKRRVEWCGCDHKVRVSQFGGLYLGGWVHSAEEWPWNDYCHDDKYPRSTGTWVWSNDASGPAWKQDAGWVVVLTVKTEAKRDIVEVFAKEMVLPTSSDFLFLRRFLHMTATFFNNCFQLIETSWNLTYIPIQHSQRLRGFFRSSLRDERSQVCSWWSWDVSHHIRGGWCELVRSPTEQKAVGFVRYVSSNWVSSDPVLCVFFCWTTTRCNYIDHLRSFFLVTT